MRVDSSVVGAAAVAVVCCLGVSLLVAVGATTLLGLAGLAIPAAVRLGIAAWVAWYVLRRSGASDA